MRVNIQAAVEAISESKRLEIILVGREEEIKTYLTKHRFALEQIKIHNALDIVPMNEKPITAARRKGTSIYQGIELVRTCEAEAFVSMGNTGAVAATAFLRLGTLVEINRTPILSMFPTMSGHNITVLDVGANVDSKPGSLLRFAVLGSVFVERIMGINNPKVALLSIGEEENKGSSAVKEAHRLLKENANTLELNFIGNVEGRDILLGTADVIVCDGFVGNILLKYTESIYHLVKTLFKKGHRISILSLLGGLLLYPSLKRTIKSFNYAEYGGAPLLGVKGNAVIGHGTSSPKAIANAILVAHNMALTDLPRAMENATERLKGVEI